MSGIGHAGHRATAAQWSAAQGPVPGSVAGQLIEFDRIVGVARADDAQDDAVPAACEAMARNCSLGWRAVLAAQTGEGCERQASFQPKR